MDGILQHRYDEFKSACKSPSLKAVLEQLDITPLPAEFVAAHKREKLEQMTRRLRPDSAREIAPEQFSGGERDELRGICTSNPRDHRPVMRFWHRFFKRNMFELPGDAPVIRFWETSTGLRFYTCLRWVRVPLEEVRDVPEFVKAKSQEITSLLPDATFTVEQMRSEHNIYDPFLIVSYGDESYYVEVWDEAEFERRYT